MESTITWHAAIEEQPDHRDPVLMATYDGTVVVGWYGSWDEMWRTTNSVYCENPEYWAELPRRP